VNYVQAIRATRRLNGIDEHQLKIYHAGVVPNHQEHGTSRTFGLQLPYAPCGVAQRSDRSPKTWETPLVSIRHMLSNRNVTLLKMDIDFNEGDLFHVVVDMIKAHETSVETILIEAGGISAPHNRSKISDSRIQY
jgi:hypothetical protein